MTKVCSTLLLLVMFSGCSIVDRPITMINDEVPHPLIPGQVVKVVVKTEEGKYIEAEMTVGNNMFIIKDKNP